MSYCPECCGKCDVSEIQLKEFEDADDCQYFECPRCLRIFELSVLLPSELPISGLRRKR